MPRIPLKRTMVSFTGQIDVPTLERIEDLARDHNRSMASVTRELLKFALRMMDKGNLTLTTKDVN